MTGLLNNRVVVADDDQDILDLVVFKLTQSRGIVFEVDAGPQTAIVLGDTAS